ncbi:outer membrane lipoprotein carrier protein LolA [Emcibacter sp. SYSU 3D8]|uniref:outer membrane lipoprotein carrier protein LolA n=1 Tax=Emcibacter sp. SYSU 3D8 TaxID=3133969 RepID=UPI0031FEA0AA
MAKPADIVRQAGAILALISGLACVVLVPAGAAAEPCLSPDQLKPKNVRQSFVQQRTFANLPRPLVSEGTVAIDDDTIVWTTTSPFKVRMTLAKDGMTQSVDDGPDEAMNMTGDISAVIVRVTSALVRARWSELTSFFTVTTAIRPDTRWLVTLSPKSGSFAALLGKVEVSGCRTVSEVTITRANGDHESIQFRNEAVEAP